MVEDESSLMDFGPTIRGFSEGQQVFGRYLLNSIVGRGGMGVVWLAKDEELEISVALKFLPEEISRDVEAVANLKRETLRGLELAHPNIVKTYGFLKDERSAAIAMEYVEGKTLSALKVEREQHPWFEVEEIAPWVSSICDALDYAHREARVIHRDLKPINLMLRPGGQIKIMDFGVAQVLQDSYSRVSAKAAAGGGTLIYMSPQQALGERPGVEDDIYSLGATIYDLLSGKAPFGGNPSTIYIQVRDKVPPSLTERREELHHSGAAIPPQWEETVAACLAKDPADRPRSAMEVAGRLGLVKDYEHKPAPAKPEMIRVSRESSKKPAASLQTEAAAVSATAKRNNWGIIVAAALVLIAAAIGASWHSSSQRPLAQTSVTPAPETVPAVSPHPAPSPPVDEPTATPQPVSTPTPVIAPSVAVVPLPTATPAQPVSPPENASPAAGETFENANRMSMVWIGNLSIWVGATDVTQAQFVAIMKFNPSERPANDHPVDNVTWTEACEFCRHLSLSENAANKLPSGCLYRLPTDSEWSAFASDTDLADAITSADFKRSGPASVASRRANKYGLFDVRGNVWQWCMDNYDPAMNTARIRAEYSGLKARGRVLRGGSWSSTGDLLQFSTRGSNLANQRDPTNGFRVVIARQ